MAVIPDFSAPLTCCIESSINTVSEASIPFSSRTKCSFDGIYPLTSPPANLTDSEVVNARRWWADLGVIDDDNLYKFKTLMDILSYSDGKMTILEIANAINESFNDIYPIVDKLVQEGLLTTIYEQ